MLVDSHCHLDRLEPVKSGEPLQTVLADAAGAGVEHMLCVGVDLASWDAMMSLIDGLENVSASVGIHPNAGREHDVDIEGLVTRAGAPQVVAIGETGLDYYRTTGDTAFQQARFRTHIDAAKHCGKPLVIHTRDAEDDTLRIMREAGAGEAGGVMHCFTGSWEMAKAAMDMGFMISFSGIVTFRNAATLQAVARKVPDEFLLVETDSPWLAPVPHRGKPNRPAWVKHVAECVAELRGTAMESVATVTTANYDRVFGRWANPPRPGSRP